MHETNLYAIRTLGAPYVKIGTAVNPSSRLREIQTGNPFKCFVYATRPCSGVPEEKTYHRRFHSLHSHGEWFRWEGALVDEVKLWKRSDTTDASEHSWRKATHKDGFRSEMNALYEKLVKANADLAAYRERMEEVSAFYSFFHYTYCRDAGLWNMCRPTPDEAPDWINRNLEAIRAAVRRFDDTGRGWSRKWLERHPDANDRVQAAGRAYDFRSGRNYV